MNDKLKLLLEEWRHVQHYWDDKSNEDADAAYKRDARRVSGEYKDRADQLEQALLP